MRYDEHDGVEFLERELSALPRAAAPPELSALVMERVLAAPAPRRTVWSVLSDRLAPSWDVTRKDCGMYFIVASGLHLTLSFLLTRILAPFAYNGRNARLLPDWILWQPQFALAVAVLFSACGLWLLLDGEAAQRWAYRICLLYLGVVAVNGLLVISSLQNVAGMGLHVFVGAGASVGFFLAAMLQHARKQQGLYHANC
jgi:hypothetical protein